MLPTSTDQGQGEERLTSRIKKYLKVLPLCVEVIFFLLIIIFLIQTIFQIDSNMICFRYANIVYNFELWRLYTFAFFHLGFLHITLNAIATLSLGIPLEKMMGTLSFSLFIFLIIPIATACIEIVIIFIITTIPYLDYIPKLFGSSGKQLIFGGGAGFSGTLFALMIFTCHFNPMERRLFGVLRVPAKLYPWGILLITSFLMPQVSFMGHLCGILAGYAIVFLMLNREYWEKSMNFLETKLIPEFLRNNFNYVSIENSLQNESTGNNDNSNFFSRSYNWMRERIRNRTQGTTINSTNITNNGETFPGRGQVLGRGNPNENIPQNEEELEEEKEAPLLNNTQVEIKPEDLQI